MGNCVGCFMIRRTLRWCSNGDGIKAKECKVLSFGQKGDGKLLEISVGKNVKENSSEHDQKCKDKVRGSGGGGGGGCGGGGCGSVRRVKVVITKQEFEQLLRNQIPVEQLLFSRVENISSNSSVGCMENWKPGLESIPEGSE